MSPVPVVLVHGVPDTVEMWDPFVAALTSRGVASDAITRVSLPGFDGPVAKDFAATKEAYADLVIAHIEALGTPVDLVGHDWGSLLTQHLALARPDLLRSYVLSDGAVTESFAWHDLAVAWQTPEVGEQVMEAMVGDAVVDALRAGGHPDATSAVEHVDATMKDSILRWYRSAVDVGAEWAPRAPAERPGFVLWGTDDPYGPVKNGEAAATAMGASFTVLDGGHWVIVERPDDSAAAIIEFWATLS